jgi:FlaA1/EpsC-like NDP-sugar epimerase
VLQLIKSLSRAHKRAILILMDSVLLVIAFWMALQLQMSTEEAALQFQTVLPALSYLILVSGLLALWLDTNSLPLNQYEAGAIGLSALHAGLVAFSAYALISVVSVQLPVTVHIVFGSVFFVLAAVARAILLQVVAAIYRLGEARCRVLIYGAGTTGMQLVSAFRSHRQIEPVAFVDDNAALQGVNVAGLMVHSPLRIAELVAEKQIDRVLLAMPSQSQPKQAQIARRLQNMGLEVQTLPSFSQLIGEEALVEKLQPMNPRSFLNRAEVIDSIGKSVAAYSDQNVLISGAGGSIGSELCRQILECRPRRLVLFELSELALYTIHSELEQLLDGNDTQIVPILGSVTDARQVRKVMQEHEITVVLHAAAYKHVPLVEQNPLAGLANNVLGAHTLAE